MNAKNNKISRPLWRPLHGMAVIMKINPKNEHRTGNVVVVPTLFADYPHYFMALVTVISFLLLHTTDVVSLLDLYFWCR